MAHVDKKIKREFDDHTPPPTPSPIPAALIAPLSTSTGISSSAAPKVDADEAREILQQSLSAFLEIKEKVENRLNMLEEKETWFKEIEALKEKYMKELDEKISLDIGGKRFSTTKTTLLQQEGNFFYTMLAGGWPPGKDGTYFIDRNPQHVDIILDFLRMRTVDVTMYDKHHLASLAEDLDFFQIHGFPFPVFDDLVGATLFNRMHADMWFPTKKFQLIYKATRDGLHQESFAKACHNKGPTLCFIKSVGGQIFGGYNPLSWGPEHETTHDPSGFIFLNKANGTDLVKFPIAKDKANISHKSNYVFIFGSNSIAVAPDQVGRTSTRNFESPSYVSTHWVRTTAVDIKETHFYVGDIEVFLVLSEKKFT